MVSSTYVIEKGDKARYGKMSKRKDDPKREKRIAMEIVVDAYDAWEQAMGWYYYLEGGRKFIKNMRAVGRITWDDNYGGELPELYIDGERVTWAEFGKMLMTFEGWQFKIDIFDRTDEVKGLGVPKTVENFSPDE